MLKTAAARFLRPRSGNLPIAAFLILVGAGVTWGGCSVDSKGFGDFDAGAGGKAAAGSGGRVGSGSGGSLASGGRGSGGVSGSGGVVGTGGIIGSGGTPSGGHVGSGGAGVGTGGSGGGSGGAAGAPDGAGGDGTGSGGKGAGGIGGGAGGTMSGSGGKGGGSGGGGGRGGGAGGAGGGKQGGGGQGGQAADNTTCDMLVADYAEALAEARACTPGAPMQCRQNASAGLNGCYGCPIFVNDATKLNQIRDEWIANGCNLPIAFCPAIACVAPGPQTCTPRPGGAPGGQCDAGLVIAPLGGRAPAP